MIAALLPIVAFTLNSAFDQQLKLALHNELKAYSYSILAVAEVEDGQLFMPEQLLENQFNVIQSGLYALITTTNQADSHAMADNSAKHAKVNSVDESTSGNSLLWQSASFLSLTLPRSLPIPDSGSSSFNEVDIENSPHLVYSFSAVFAVNEQNFPITLHIIKDQVEFLQLAQDFKNTVWRWLFLLIVVFIIVQFIWLAWTLKPLTFLTDELEDIEQGKQNALKGSYPEEIAQVTAQVNTLLNTEQQQRKRYRNALADLAHSLKTPLAVIQSQQGLSADTIEQLQVINATIEHQLKRAQSAGESSWHLGIGVKPSVDKLITTLEKIYLDKTICFHTYVAEGATFKGDESDLIEMLGNLLDNACKAAKQEVELVVEYSVNDKHQQLIISIADDGQGISEAVEKAVFDRGTRVDTYQQGHGIGLAIVRDLVASYQGEIAISRSNKLGGALFILTFVS